MPAKAPRAVGKPSKHYTGIEVMNGRFQARVKHRGRRWHAGTWTTAREAAIARDRVLLHLVGPIAQLQVPEISRQLGPAAPEQMARLGRERIDELRPAGSFLGVYRAATRRWCARIYIGRKIHAVHGFSTAREAAVARDRLALALLGPDARLNFPDQRLVPATVEHLRRERDQLRRNARGLSRYVGVRRVAQKAGWCASISTGGSDGRVFEISGFASEKAAAEARDRMARYFPDSRPGSTSQNAILNPFRLTRSASRCESCD